MHFGNKMLFSCVWCEFSKETPGLAWRDGWEENTLHGPYANSRSTRGDGRPCGGAHSLDRSCGNNSLPAHCTTYLSWHGKKQKRNITTERGHWILCMACMSCVWCELSNIWWHAAVWGCSRPGSLPWQCESKNPFRILWSAFLLIKLI